MTTDEARVLIFAPYGREATLACEVLGRDGLGAAVCRSAEDFQRELTCGAGALLLTEEALSAATLETLTAFLSEQPAWSDLPVLLFVARADMGARSLEVIRPLRERWNVTVLERPVRSATLVTVVRAALRARGRQYELRDLLAELDARIETRTSELSTANVRLRREIAERETAQTQMSLSEARFAKIFHASPLPIVISTLAGGRYLDLNESALKLLDFRRDEVVGRTAAELGQWRPEDGGVRRNLLRRLEERGSLRDVDLTFRTKRGDLRYALGAFEVIELDGERCLLTMFVDITERKRTEAQLKEAVEKTMENATWFSHQVMDELARLKAGDLEPHEFVQLTNRERDVLSRIAAGKSNGDIGAELGLAEQTVRNYITNVYSKLDLHSRAEAVVWARERGL